MAKPSEFCREVTLRLDRAGVDLHQARSAAGLYAPWLIHGDLIHISGQVSALPDQEGITGCVGRDIATDRGRVAARICAINLLAQISAALAGDFSRFKRFIHVRGYVQAAPDYCDLDAVMDGCSEFLIEILGWSARGARTVIGVVQLPRNHAVEIDVIAEIDGDIRRDYLMSAATDPNESIEHP